MTISICLHGPPSHPSDDNPSYSHRVAGDGVCGLDLGTAHVHKQSNANLCREAFKISGSHCRKFNLPEPKGSV